MGVSTWIPTPGHRVLNSKTQVSIGQPGFSGFELLLVTTSKALVTSSDALVPSSFLLLLLQPIHPFHSAGSSQEPQMDASCPAEEARGVEAADEYFHLNLQGLFFYAIGDRCLVCSGVYRNCT